MASGLVQALFVISAEAGIQAEVAPVFVAVRISANAGMTNA